MSKSGKATYVEDWCHAKAGELAREFGKPVMVTESAFAQTTPSGVEVFSISDALAVNKLYRLHGTADAIAVCAIGGDRFATLGPDLQFWNAADGTLHKSHGRWPAAHTVCSVREGVVALSHGDQVSIIGEAVERTFRADGRLAMFAVGENRLVCAGLEALVVFDTATWDPVFSIPFGMYRCVLPVSDSLILVTEVGQMKETRLVCVNTGEYRGSYGNRGSILHRGIMKGAMVSSNLLASFKSDYSVELWDMRTGIPKFTFTAPGSVESITLVRPDVMAISVYGTLRFSRISKFDRKRNMFESVVLVGGRPRGVIGADAPAAAPAEALEEALADAPADAPAAEKPEGAEKRARGQGGSGSGSGSGRSKKEKEGETQSQAKRKRGVGKAARRVA